jgi:hypothetical protein
MDTPDIPRDLADFIEECEKGDVYEMLALTWNWPRAFAGARLLRDERNKVKDAVFESLLFGRIPRDETWGIEKYDRWLLFERDFPTIADYLRAMKLSPPRDHSVVARVAQRVEAWIMLEQLCGRLLSDHPEIEVITVHDSLLVQKRYAGLVKYLIQEEWAHLGLNPTIKIK